MKAREWPLAFGVFPLSLGQVADAVVRMLLQSQTEGRPGSRVDGSGESQEFRSFRRCRRCRWCRWCRQGEVRVENAEWSR